LAAVERALTDRPLTPAQLRSFLLGRFSRWPAAALAYACRCYLPLVQVPPRGVWGSMGQVTLTPLTSWTGAPLVAAPSLDELILRYLAAAGPATVADAAAWTRLTRLGEVFDRLGSQVNRLRDEAGRTLYDLPDGPLPHPDTPAPVRFLPEYDNALLSHTDRTRFDISPERTNRFSRVLGPAKGSVLVDGLVQAVWRVDRDRPTGPALVVEHATLARLGLDEVEAEANRVAAFWLASDQPDVHLRLLPDP
jgi:Winged helix DNA-binding domain